MEIRLELVIEDEKCRLRAFESSPGTITLELARQDDDIYGGEITVPLDDLIEGLNQLKRSLTD